MPTRESPPAPADVDRWSAALGGSIASSSAVSEVARRLLDVFTDGTLAPGDRLPPERQLAASMGVGRSAVREALAALEVLGVVSVRPGSGTYLRGRASELLPQTLSWGLLIGAQKSRELIEVRHGLEVQAARLAATTADGDSVARLTAELATMEQSTTDLDDFVAADRQFHQVLGEATGNRALADLLQSLRSLLRVWVDRALDDRGHARLACTEHRAVLDAVTAHDPDRAAAAMDRHMRSAAERLLPTLGEE